MHLGRHHHRPRLVRLGDTFTIDEERDGLIELDEVPPDPDPPPEDIQGEPWGWTKGPPYPRGYDSYRDAHGYRDGDDDGAR